MIEPWIKWGCRVVILTLFFPLAAAFGGILSLIGVLVIGIFWSFNQVKPMGEIQALLGIWGEFARFYIQQYRWPND